MKQPLGDTMFNFSCVILIGTFIGGWILLIVIMLVQKFFPIAESTTERFLQKISKPIEQIQKYSFIVLAVLFLLRVLTAFLGWAPSIGSDLIEE